MLLKLPAPNGTATASFDDRTSSNYFGPVLPPVMQWKRTFEKVLPLIGISDIPKFVFRSDLDALLNKQSWEILFNTPAPKLQLLRAPVSVTQFKEVTPV